MIPIPQYSLYSDTLSLYGAYQIQYYLDEDNDWALNIEELERALDEAKGKCVPRGIVVINPGNPTGKKTTFYYWIGYYWWTGQVLSPENIKTVIKFGMKWMFFSLEYFWIIIRYFFLAHKHKLFIVADEVYQENIYLPDRNFCSFKKALMDLGSPYNQMQMGNVLLYELSQSIHRVFYICAFRVATHEQFTVSISFWTFFLSPVIKAIERRPIYLNAQVLLTSLFLASFHSASKGWHGE